MALLQAIRMTLCKQGKLSFQDICGRRVEGAFDGGKLSTDGGLLLVREVACGSRFFTRLKGCFIDKRNQDAITHSIEALIQQRVYGLLAGYEDLNDHDSFRNDPVAQLVAGHVPGETRLAGHSTLGRLELSARTVAAKERDKKIALDDERLQAFLIEEFIRYAKRQKLQELVLDVDATDIPLHGKQEERFYHGYYGHYCYLPLYIFCDEFPLWAELRPSGIDASHGTVEALTQIVQALKTALPGVSITVRADSAFAREHIMAFCENSGIHYVFGLARNSRLEALVTDAMDTARADYERTQEPARVFCELSYKTLDTWSRSRRVVAKAEYLPKGPNPRFIVTNLKGSGRQLYEQLYCGRGDAENRIKEQFQLFAGRASSSVKRANQIRLWFSTIAYLLMVLVRKSRLKGTLLENAEVHTLRVRLIMCAVQVTVSVRRVYLSFAEGFPFKDVFHHALQT